MNLAFHFFSFLCLVTIGLIPAKMAHCLSATEPSPSNIGEAYQLKGLAEIVQMGIEAPLKSSLTRMTQRALSDVLSESGSALSIKRWQDVAAIRADSQLRKRIRDKIATAIQQALPGLAHDILYQHLVKEGVLASFPELEEFESHLVAALTASWNELADRYAQQAFDTLCFDLISKLQYTIHLPGRDIELDGTDWQASIERLVNLDTVVAPLSEKLAHSYGKEVVGTIRRRMDALLSGELPPEMARPFREGTARIDQALTMVQDNLPGEKLRQLTDKVMDIPLLTIPNPLYSMMLSGSAAAHFSRAYQGVSINFYELKRGKEVLEAMKWQIQHKENVSLNVGQFISLSRYISEKFGLKKLSQLGSFGRELKLAAEDLKKIEQMIVATDKWLESSLVEPAKLLKEKIAEMEAELIAMQERLARPLLNVKRRAESSLASLRGSLKERINDRLNGWPRDWTGVKKMSGLPEALFGKKGENTLARFLHMDRLGRLVNEKVANGLARASVNVLSFMHLLGPVGKILFEEEVPAINRSDDNPLDPVFLHNGEFYIRSRDMEIPGRGLDYRFERIYRSRSSFTGILGRNWTHNYGERLLPLAEAEAGGVTWVSDEGLKFQFIKNGAAYDAPDGLRESLQKTGSGYAMMGSDQIETLFLPNGIMILKRDTYGNSLHFFYDENWQLRAVKDSFDRVVYYHYRADGLLESIGDEAGRTVRFMYDDQSRLITRKLPATDAFPNGSRTDYHYTSGFQEDSLNHNLDLIMDANGTIFLKNRYGSNGLFKDRIIAQKFGDDSWITVDYNPLYPPWMTHVLVAKGSYLAQQVTLRQENKICRYYLDLSGQLVSKSSQGQWPINPAPQELSHPIKVLSRNRQGAPLQALDHTGASIDYHYYSGQRAWEYSPDGDGYMATISTASGQIRLGYDRLGNVISLMDESGQWNLFILNARNQPERQISSTGDEWAFDYDANGNIKEILRREGKSDSFHSLVHYRYDSADRLRGFPHEAFDYTQVGLNRRFLPLWLPTSKEASLN